jgi:GNAT superfamily N-acetyltransferase
MTYDIVKYSPELSGDVARLQTVLWSSDVDTNAKYVEWKYHQNPYAQPPLVYLALTGGRVVGMRGFMGSRWQIGNESLSVPLACDLAIEPAHRDRGVFSLLMGAALEDLAELGYRYVFNLSAQRETLVASLATGWRSVGSLGVLRRSTRAVGGTRRLVTKLGALRSRCESIGGRILSRGSLGHPFSRLDGTARRQPHPRIGLATAPRVGEMARFVERTTSRGLIRHVRDEAFFAWRFRNPRASYRFLFWEDAGFRGYLILVAGLSYEPDRFYPTVRILDWEAADAEVESELLKAALAWGRFSSLETWSTGLSESASGLLERHGFRPSGPEPSFRDPGAMVLVRPTKSQIAEADWVAAGVRLLDIDNWDLRQAYSDHN